MSTYRQMRVPPSALENPEWILSGFNRASTTSLGDIVLLVQAGPISRMCSSQWWKTCPLLMSSWTHMASRHEGHPFMYHQMVSYLTKDRQIDLLAVSGRVPMLSNST
ncbi:hypothetical protein CK203_022427 [Vitis vinifera]|uniref:Uncharacterized protein n=1 Tax=Vitis vinifera TaxID=29760 RepID=A0A438I9H1_VITVI|nr:hypothetical protein CK203_022427 [Vitis vinifera]